MKSETGFTLAEVLITLGIIGVVAAMTIPTLVNNYQKKVTVTGLQKVYSEFSQAYTASQAQNGDATDWSAADPYYSRANILTFWQTYFFPYLKISKICDSADGSDFYDCWSSDIKNLDGTLYSATDVNTAYNLTFILADGATVYTASAPNYGSIYVDINGKSKPNVLGKDVFRLDFGYNGLNGLHIDGYDRTRSDILNGTPPNAINSCNKAYRGTMCGSVIQKDGWQIKDDYPW